MEPNQNLISQSEEITAVNADSLSAEAENTVQAAAGCLGSLGTLGTLGGCFGTAGTYGCGLEDSAAAAE